MNYNVHLGLKLQFSKKNKHFIGFTIFFYIVFIKESYNYYEQNESKHINIVFENYETQTYQRPILTVCTNNHATLPASGIIICLLFIICF